MQKKIIILLTISLLMNISCFACSMFKLTLDGKTIVGNNEDYYNPMTNMWVIPSSRNQYGAIFFGFDDYFAQGGVNEKGLVFDGFAIFPGMEVLNTEGKEKISSEKFMEKLMAECATVDEVEAFVKKYNLYFLKDAQLMFVDKAGNSIILEGDEIIKSDKNYQISTNFYQSQIQNPNQITCDRYLAGDAILRGEQSFSKDYAKSVLKAMHQKGFWGGTQYSNIYDLHNGMIYLYFYHNFEEEVSINIQETIKKGKYKTDISALFKPHKEYEQFKINYQSCKTAIEKLSKSRKTTEIKPLLNHLLDNQVTLVYGQQLAEMGDKFLKNKESEQAVLIFKFCTVIFPQSWQFHTKLSQAYYQNHQKTEALASLQKAIELAPENEQLKQMLKQLEE